MLKKLARLKEETEQTKSQSNNNIHSFNEIKITFYQDGFGTSKNSMGTPTILRTSLENLYQKYIEDIRINKELQNELKKPIIEEKNKIKTEILKRETAKDIKQKEIKDINEEIDKFKYEISDVRQEPNKYGIDATKKSKAQFFIGLIILLPLTIYLLVFYISASFSAFFKNFNNTDVMAAIFDGHSFAKALEHGALEAVFIITIPFVFMGLGYLIHMFLKEKTIGIIKIIGILVVTFIFDSLLAYQIEQKIYMADRKLNSADFNFIIAFNTPEFWSIIFAGFIVYIIWGLVFDFLMKEYEEIDTIKVFINSHKEKINNLSTKKEKLFRDIASIENDIISLKGKVTQLQDKISGFIFDKKKYLLFHTEYMKGWFLAISKEIALPHREKNELIAKCEEVSNKHLLKLGFNNSNYDNILNMKVNQL